MTVLEVEGRKLGLTNLDKVLWPEAGRTKGWMIDYYVRVAPVLLPHGPWTRRGSRPRSILNAARRAAGE